MDPIQALILALVQGITEFLPISSSAHLILPARILGWADQGLAFDVAVHLGSLVAVLGILRREMAALITGTLRAGVERKMNADFRLGLLLVIATVPVVIVGFTLKDVIETHLRSVSVIAATTVGFGLLLWFADTRGSRTAEARGDDPTDPLADLRTVDLRAAVVVGLAQCLALVPGTSRSGITMTAGLLIGQSRTACARFSFLLSIPTIAGAAVLAAKDLLEAPTPVDWTALGLGFAAAAASAWACIRFFLNLVERIGFLPFVLYRLALGAALFIFLL